MTLQEIIEANGRDVVVKLSGKQSEPIRVLNDLNDLVYYVEGVQSGYKYTERKDKDGFEVVETTSKRMQAAAVAIANE